MNGAMRNKLLLRMLFCGLTLSVLGGCAYKQETAGTEELVSEVSQAADPTDEETLSAGAESSMEETASGEEYNHSTEAISTEEALGESHTAEDDQTLQESAVSEAEESSQEIRTTEPISSSEDTQESTGQTISAPPLQTGVFTYELSHPEFLQVSYAGDEAEYDTQTIYNGGNQSWFYNAYTGEGDAQLENEGCGLIAAADTLLYLSLYHAGYEKLIAPAAFAAGSPLDYSAYQSYVLGLRERDDLFPLSAQFGGALGTSLASGITRYGQEQGYNIQAKWGGRSKEIQSAEYVNEASARAMLSAYFEGEELEENTEKFQRKTNTILDMLSKDVPVIMAIGPFSEMNLYQYAQDGENAGQLVSAGAVGGHYFIVTNATVNFDTMQILMEIETWGETYVIDYLEFSAKIYKGMAYLSDILYIDLK